MSRTDRSVLLALILTTLTVLGLGCAELGALAPALTQAAGAGLTTLIEAEAKAQKIPTTDPAYQAALKAAQALEGEQKARMDSILAELRRQRAVAPCATSSSTAPSVAPVLPAVLPRAGAVPVSPASTAPSVTAPGPGIDAGPGVGP